MKTRPALLASVLIALGGALFAACGNSAGALGHQACVDVHASLALYRAAASAGDQATKTRLGEEASAKLRDALQPAALAGSEDGSWQALEITLSESNRVSEGTLSTALTAQCAATLGAG